MLSRADRKKFAGGKALQYLRCPQKQKIIWQPAANCRRAGFGDDLSLVNARVTERFQTARPGRGIGAN